MCNCYDKQDLPVLRTVGRDWDVIPAMVSLGCVKMSEKGTCQEERAENEPLWRCSGPCSDHLFVFSESQPEGHQAEINALSDDGKLKALN